MKLKTTISAETSQLLLAIRGRYLLIYPRSAFFPGYSKWGFERHRSSGYGFTAHFWFVGVSLDRATSPR